MLIRCERYSVNRKNFVNTMKCICISLLVICALQIVQSREILATRQYDVVSNYRLPEHRNGESFINFIENIANQTIQLAKDAIKVLQARIDQLLLDIRDKLFGIQQTGDDALNELLKDVEKFSGENTRSGIGSCVQNHMDEIRQIIATGREDMLKCIQEAMNEADTISQSLFPYVESISTLIKNVSGIIDQCSASSNPFSVAICISQHVTDVSTAISAIIRDSQEAIRLAIVQVNALVLNTRGCVKTATDAARAAVENIIKECNSGQSSR